MARSIARLGLAVVGLVGIGSAPGSVPNEKLASLAHAAGEPEPLYRVGLEPATAYELTSPAPFRIVDPETGADLWRPRHEGPLRVVVDGAPAAGVPSVFRVQVGSFSTSESATRESERWARELGVEATVRHDPDRGRYRVRLGGSRDRLALQPLVERARGAGFEDAWIVEEPDAVVGRIALRLVDAAFDSRRLDGSRLAVVPTGGKRLSIDGVEVRGILEVRTNEFGKLRAVNWLGIEHYLRGVVPRELGPEIWPEIEALKAQAVAARTYAWRNRGQFDHEGFDLCSTPRCQVYGGSSAEHPLSDRAVSATRGEVLIHEGRPIVAYYTATCGGHTENGEAIFPGEVEPYLRGVECRAEGEALRALRGTLRGRPAQAQVDETGTDVTRDLALLGVAGVVDAGALALDPVTPALLRSWTSRLARLAGLPEPTGPARPAGSLGEAAAAVVDDLGWRERARVLLAAEDLDAVLRDTEASGRPDGERAALAYLALVQALRPHPEGGFRLGETPRVGRIATVLSRIGDTYDAFGLQPAVVSGVSERSVRFVRQPGEIRVDVGDEPRLFSLVAGRPVPAASLDLWPGDRVRYRTGRHGTIDYLELSPPIKGTSDDRSAVVYSWEERRSRREVEAAIGQRLSVGALRSLEVVERGVSGRVTKLRVVGSRGTAEVEGFHVRTLLGLRESLVVIETLRGAEGEIETVVFAGKGWGHGVGLCQVGAYGMALRGASYREILSHYYRGAVLTRNAPGSD